MPKEQMGVGESLGGDKNGVPLDVAFENAIPGWACVPCGALLHVDRGGPKPTCCGGPDFVQRIDLRTATMGPDGKLVSARHI